MTEPLKAAAEVRARAQRDNPVEYEIYARSDSGRIRKASASSFASMDQVNDFLFNHPGRRYFVCEIRRSADLIKEYDLRSARQ